MDKSYSFKQTKFTKKHRERSKEARYGFCKSMKFQDFCSILCTIRKKNPVTPPEIAKFFILKR